MNRLQQILAGSCVVCLFIFLAPKGFGQGSPATSATAKADFMKGQLLKVENHDGFLRVPASTIFR